MSTGGPWGLLHLTPPIALLCPLLGIPRIPSPSQHSSPAPPCDRALVPFLKDPCVLHTSPPPPRPTLLTCQGSRSPVPHSMTKPSLLLSPLTTCTQRSPPRNLGIQPGASCAPHPPHLLLRFCSVIQAVAFTSSALLFPGEHTLRDTSFLEGPSDLLEPPGELERYPSLLGWECQGCSPPG